MYNDLKIPSIIEDATNYWDYLDAIIQPLNATVQSYSQNVGSDQSKSFAKKVMDIHEKATKSKDTIQALRTSYLSNDFLVMKKDIKIANETIADQAIHWKDLIGLINKNKPHYFTWQLIRLQQDRLESVELYSEEPWPK